MYAPHRLLKRVYYIREFLSFIQDKDTEVFVLDEAGNFFSIFSYFGKGFGTSPFSHYSYALVGEKALKNWPKLYKNTSCCATIS